MQGTHHVPPGTRKLNENHVQIGVPAFFAGPCLVMNNSILLGEQGVTLRRGNLASSPSTSHMGLAISDDASPRYSLAQDNGSKYDASIVPVTEV